MFCHNCGTKLDEGAMFCPECGAKQEEGNNPKERVQTWHDEEKETTPQELEGKRSGGSKKFIFAIIAVIVVGIASGVGGFLIWEKASSPERDNTKIAQEESLKNSGKSAKKTEEKEEKKEQDKEGEEKPEKTEEKAEEKPEERPEEEPEEKVYIHEYEVVQGLWTWTDAEAYCQSQGGHLATVSSQEEYEQIVAKANETGCLVLWLGASRMDGSNEFQWVTDEASSFYAWAEGEPNNDGGAENCLGMMKVGGVWGMYDLPNDVSPYYTASKVGFVMERDIEQ